jgi:hypothetical protein
MQKVYIVQVQGWGEQGEDVFENVSAHSTRELAEQAVIDVTEQAFADGLDDIVTDIVVMTVDA